MKYKVVAYRSLTFCRVFKVMKLRHEPMFFGPWKRLKTAKKYATMLRKERCQTLPRWDDHGPSFARVAIVEVPE